MRKFLCAIAVILAACVLTACSTQDPAPIQQYTLDELLSIAHERRISIPRVDRNRLTELAADRAPNTLDLTPLLNPSSQRHTISADAAAEDAVLFLETLRQLYGLYTYFGGDEVFMPMLDNVLAHLAAVDEITVSQLRSMLFREVSLVVIDNHFWFDTTLPINVSANFFTTDARFSRDAYGFWCKESGLLVSEIAGHDKQRLMRLSMDEYGNIFYSPIVYLMESRASYVIDITFEDGGNSQLTLYRFRDSDPVLRPPLGLEFIDNIPVVSITSMGWAHPTSDSYEDASTFVGFATKLRERDEPAIIIDVRGNRGGNGALSTQWLYELTGELVPKSYAALSTFTYAELMQAVSDDPIQMYNHLRFGGFVAFDDNHSTCPLPQTDTLVPNERLIIMLVDRHTTSAGEGFVDNMFNMENTLVIGQNTRGMLAGSGAFNFVGLNLPNSGINVRFGRTANIHPEGHFAEGVGFAPDVWVHGDALIAALGLIDNNRDD